MKMNTTSLLPWATALLACGAFCALAFAAPSPVIYPAKGQGTAQTDRDKYECFEWSKGQSGFDPTQAVPAPAMTLPQAATPSAAPQTHSAAGMVKGAAGGAAVAELADRDAGKGAAVGVLGSAVRERMKQQQQQGAQAQQQLLLAQQQAQFAQQQQARAQQRSVFDRGFAACLEARGYVVK